jgi:hypothetical protein
MLKKLPSRVPALRVTASLRPPTLWTRCIGESNGYPEYASGLHLLRPRPWKGASRRAGVGRVRKTTFLSILRVLLTPHLISRSSVFWV